MNGRYENLIRQACLSMAAEEVPSEVHKEQGDAMYKLAKGMNPIKTVLVDDIDLEDIIKSKCSWIWEDMKELDIDFKDVDGVLDYLYGQKILNPKESYIQVLIDRIERSCE